MFVSERYKPEELLFLNAYDLRASLNHDEKRQLEILERGYQGECVYDEMFDKIGHAGIFIFRDIYLKIGESVTQFDALIIDNEQVTINEIKNYRGKYHMKNDNWYVNNNRMGDHPLVQLKRAEGKIIKLGREAGYRLNVHGKVIFPNDSFKLETSDEQVWDKIIFRNDMYGYFDGFYKSQCDGIAEDIVKMIHCHIVPNPYFSKTADFKDIKKGLYCMKCRRFDLIHHRYRYNCLWCGHNETSEKTVLRAISDFSILFRSIPMTKAKFLEFTGAEVGPKMAQRYLNKYCRRVNKSQCTYYKFKYHHFEDALKNGGYHSKYDKELHEISQ